MAGIFDFIKKQAPNANPTPSSSGTVVATVTSTTEEVVPHGGSYNGIGSPPGGSSFNGIGEPPMPVAQAPQPPVQVIQQPVMPDPQVVAPISHEQAAKEAQKLTLQDPGAQTVDQPEEVIDVVPPVPSQPGSAPTQTPQEVGGVTPPPASPQEEMAKQTVDNAQGVLGSQITDKKRNDLDIMTHLTQRSNKVFVEANNKAKELKSTYMDSEHLLHGLLTDGEIFKVLTDLKVQPQIVEQELAQVYKKEECAVPPQIAPRVKQIIETSLTVARKLGFEFISPEHLLLALYEEGEGVGARVLVKLGITKEDINKRITGKKAGVVGVGVASIGANGSKQKAKSALDQFTIDLTQKAANGELDPVVERAPVIERIVHILSRRIKNNPALIGEPGVGKTAVIEGLAQRIVEKQVPESLLNKRILQLDLVGVIAGASHRGEFEERMKNIMDELKASKGEIIMFIDEMHTMIGAGSGDGALDASNFIKPALARGEVQFIGATTITEYRKYIEKDAALERRFQTVVVPEPTEEAAIKMLKAARDKYESFHKVKISDEVIELAVKLSKRYIGDRFLPDKGFDLMDEAAAAVRLPLISLPEEIKSIESRIAQLNQEMGDDERRGEKVKARILRSKISEIESKLKGKQDEYNMKKAQTTTSVTPSIIKDLIAARTGIPISKIGTQETDKLTKMEDIIHKRMIDQERAVASVSQAVRRGRAGLKSNSRPIGSFVFLGPSGVGKTELAKTLAEVLFDEEDAVIRFDMTEYMERHEVAKLLGPPPGYVGFEEGGKLTEAVRRRPYSLILFDEIEKAHPDIFNILLQILDDARLTDNKGRTISFKNTVVICTSNIGTAMIQQELLKSGKSEVVEPTMVSTYVFTPRGRELMTIGNKYFERDGMTLKKLEPMGGSPQNQKPASWMDHKLVEYFAGQKLDGKPVSEQKQEVPETDDMLEKDDQAVPETKDLKEEKKDESIKVTSFPSFGYDTHAISPQGVEMITTGDILYIRNATTSKVWNVTNLIDYFNDHVVINALPDAPDEQLPTVRLKTHAFASDEMEIVSYKDRFWKRKAGTTDWQTGLLKEYFIEQTENANELPVTHWDIHTFSPGGKEIIVVGTDVWFKESKTAKWTKQSIEEYFGGDFPLEKEVEAKEKVEEETDVKKYQVIKDKVLNELLKFFRPELVNRFDEVIVFEPLKFKHMLLIVDLQIKALSKLLEEQEIGFSVTDVAKKAIVREGFDPLYGARPLRRAIQKLVENPISEMIISQRVKAGDTLIVDFDGDEFIFNVEKIVKTEEKESPNEGKEQLKTETFMCSVCQNEFVTEVSPRATPICPKEASSKVQPVEVVDDGAKKPSDLKTGGTVVQQKPQSPMGAGLPYQQAPKPQGEVRPMPTTPSTPSYSTSPTMPLPPKEVVPQGTLQTGV